MTIPFDLDFDEILTAEEPWVALAAERSRGWVARSRYGLHVLDFEAAQDILRDRRFETNAQPLIDGAGVTNPVVRDLMVSDLFGSRPVDHDRIRKLVAPYFTKRVVDALREYVVDLIGRLARQGEGRDVLDVVADIFAKVPPLVFTQMIGAPAEDAARIGQWSVELLRIFARDPGDGPAIERAQLELLDYVDALIETRRRTPGGDDMISALLAAEQGGQHLTSLELRAVVSEALGASTDNTTSALAALLYAATLHPQSWQLIRDDATRIPRYVEEVGRMWPRILHTQRTAVTDVKWRGLNISAGTEVYIAVAAALRDENQFPDPDTFDPARQSAASANLNYGSGAHHCIGAALARMEMHGALQVLTCLWSHVELADEPQITVNFGNVNIERLPLRITWAESV